MINKTAMVLSFIGHKIVTRQDIIPTQLCAMTGGNCWKGRLLRLEYKRAGEFAPFSALFQIELIALHDLKIETRHNDLCCHENDHTVETETFLKHIQIGVSLHNSPKLDRYF